MMYNFDRFTTYKVVNENGEKQYGLFPKNKTKAKQLIGKAKERANWRIEKFTDADWEEFRNWEAEEEKRLARPAEDWELAGYNANPDNVVWQFEN